MINISRCLERFFVPRLVEGMERLETSIPDVWVYTSQGSGAVADLIEELSEIPIYWRRYLERNPVSVIHYQPAPATQIFYRYMTSDLRHGPRMAVFNLIYRSFRQSIRKRGIQDRILNRRRIRAAFDRRFGRTDYGRHLRMTQA